MTEMGLHRLTTITRIEIDIDLLTTIMRTEMD